MSLAKRLKAATEAGLKRLAKNASEAPGRARDGLTDLVVWNVPAVNTRLLICHAPGTNGSDPMSLVNVQVRYNHNFVKKMPLRARQTGPRSFILEGPTPRWKGKW